MKLLLDQNLSYKLCATLGMLFPGTSHVRQRSLIDADDMMIREHARQHGFTVLTKDRDFVEAALRLGAPPKVVWLRCGNRSSQYIEDLLLRWAPRIVAFGRDPESIAFEIA